MRRAEMRLLVASAIAVAAPAAAAAQSTSLVIKDVTVIDGTGAPPRANMTVVVRNGRIAAIDSTSRATIPATVTIVGASGKFLIPGLWDMHVHLAKAGDKALGVFVANGVTSVRDMGGDFALVQRWRSEIAAATRVGPRIRSAGPILETAEHVRSMKAEGTVEPVDRFRAPVAGTIDARRVVDSVARLGADFIKMRSVASPAVYLAVASATRRAGLTLAAHGDIAPPETMLAAGQRSMEHAIYPSLQKRDAAIRERLIRRLASEGVAVVPTMVNYYEWLLVSPTDARRVVEDTLGRTDPRRKFVSGYLVEDWREQVAERGRVMDALIRHLYLPYAFRGVLRDLREMNRGGVAILPGTDVAVALMYPGFSLHDELGYFVDKIGMTPMEALMSATRNAAKFSGMLDSLGTIEVGKLADLVLLDANPLADIRNVARADAVMVRGRLFDSAGLAALLAEATARP